MDDYDKRRNEADERDRDLADGWSPPEGEDPPDYDTEHLPQMRLDTTAEKHEEPPTE